MKKESFYPYIIVVFLLFMSVSISKSKIGKFQEILIGSFIPTRATLYNKKGGSDLIRLKTLELENELLKNQANSFYEYLQFEEKIGEQFDLLKQITTEGKEDLYWNEFFRRRADEIKSVLKINLESIPAKVIYRDPNSYSSSLWINIGEKQNENIGRSIISKNSPVVIGKNLVGIIEHVGKNSSRVRLITDAGLIPSVRAIRGGIQNKKAYQALKDFKNQIFSREDLFLENEKELLLKQLYLLETRLLNEKEDNYLAKGELYGSSEPFFRSRGIKLKGVGFNYDYPDEEGPSRELKSGKLLMDNISIKSDPLLKVGDLLITTGMDGIFPPGLNVAIVSKVEDLIDGDTSYDIEATPTATNINELDFVFVLPAIEFDNN
ncbi:MAG: hypothetical protein A3F40_01195 [Chlamydiae bacterium RIFCSPHIGHO2_12_FULL_27_8]|nr:MAG: hypothetical protein A3F40_01195 [Chlamydiae bacterium RIFCSPHIGHO2_12_FULL_27_8]